MKLSRGSIVLVDLDPTRGHEQRGTRPCVVASDPEVAEDQRYPLLAVIPISGTPGAGVLYPRLAPGPSGLRKASWALIDQLRSVDKRRVVRVYGQLGPAELEALDAGLRLFLCLPAAS
jgi:mRNA interferase MazF